MYSGPADVTFFHNYIRLSTNRHEIYFNVGVEITLSDFQPHIAQLEFGADL